MHLLVTDDESRPVVELTVDWDKLRYKLTTPFNEKKRSGFTSREGMEKSVDKAFGELLTELWKMDRQAFEVQAQAMCVANLREIFGTLTFSKNWNAPETDAPPRKTKTTRKANLPTAES